MFVTLAGCRFLNDMHDGSQCSAPTPMAIGGGGIDGRPTGPHSASLLHIMFNFFLRCPLRIVADGARYCLSYRREACMHITYKYSIKMFEHSENNAQENWGGGGVNMDSGNAMHVYLNGDTRGKRTRV